MEFILALLNYKSLGIASLLLGTISQVQASSMSDCIARQVEIGTDKMTLGEIRGICEAQISIARDDTITLFGKETKAGAVSRRIIQERQSEQSEFVLTPHRMNYILPVYTTNEINPDVYLSDQSFDNGLKNVEAKFQLSLKFPLTYNSLFVEGDRIYGAFTIEAWWQVYANDISSPFRETNYNPELFYVMPLDWHPYEGNTGLMLGIEHQSNGRSVPLSRSWNRVFAELIFEKENWVWFVRPWYRLSEDTKTDPLEPGGDDNPDFADYMGMPNTAWVTISAIMSWV